MLESAAALAFMGVLSLSVCFVRTCPAAPDPPSGHIYPLDNHGHVVYLTLWQHRWFEGLLAFAFASVATLVCKGLVEWFSRSGEPRGTK